MNCSVNKTISVVTTGLIVLTLGCTQQSDSSASGKSSISLVGSLTKQAIVAKTKLEYFFNFVFPKANAEASALADAAANDVIVNEAWISLQEIKVKAAAASEAEFSEDYVIQGPLAVNLLSDQPFSSEISALPANGYDAITMKFHKADVALDGAPSELIDNSIYLSGYVNGHAFTYIADDSTEFIISGTKSVQADQTGGLVLVFELANLIGKINLSGITADTIISENNKVVSANACPEIDPSASDLFTCFEKGLKTEAEFGKHDGDYDLDDSSDETID